MKPEIETIKKIRNFLLGIVEGLTAEQLNTIPKFFNNNIIWNIGHLIATQQQICYIKSGLKINIDEIYFTSFIGGTKPDRFISEAEINEKKKLLITSIDQLNSDYENNLFSKYNPWITRYGKGLKDIDDVINILPFHDGLHLGNIMALKRML